ncbi:MAG: FtsK/SpoIIIE domain-containing protein [Pirellulaceae bacterium]
MKSTKPKPLPQQRLNKLIYGLRERMTGSLQATAERVELLRDGVRSREDALKSELAVLEKDHQSQALVTMTDNDQAVMESWDEAERRTFAAIYETAANEKKLKNTAQAEIDSTRKEAEAKVRALEQQFLKAKEKPLARLRKFRSANQQLAAKLDQVEDETSSVLARRSLSVPESVAEVPGSDLASITTSSQAYEQTTECVQQCDEQARRITHNLIARFLDSVWFWLAGLVLFGGLIGILIGFSVLPPVNAIIWSSGITVGSVLLAFLGLRPWLKRSALREYPVLLGLLGNARKTTQHGEQLALQESEAELTRLAGIRDSKFDETKQWREDQVNSINDQFESTVRELREKAAQEKQASREWLTQSLDKTQLTYDAREKQEKTEFQQQQDSRQAEYQALCQQTQDKIKEIGEGSARRILTASKKALQIVARNQAWCDAHFPAWEKFSDSDFWPSSSEEPLIPLGNLAAESMLAEASKIQLDASQLTSQVLFAPIADQYLVIHGDPNDPVHGKPIRDLVRNLLLRAYTSLAPGRVQATVIDAPGLGKDFGWLMHLGDFDPQLVSHRVWTQTPHIDKQLAALSLAAEDTIQQALRNEYSNIVEYNRDAGALAEPFRILLWSSMPNGLDDHGWKPLQSILDSGARCGIIPIFVIDPGSSWPSKDYEEGVLRRGLHVRFDSDSQQFVASRPGSQSLQFTLGEVPSESTAQDVIREVGRRSLLSNRVEVPLDKMVPPKQERWQGDSSTSLEIPIGQSGVGRTHSLKLGIGTAQHAIIAGKTGSGKSSLLHALITSAMLKYSPEALRLVLLDFKKGVEFQTYSDAQVPHADIIGIESHREFGLSALEYVDGCMQRRGESFRASGVQDVASWNALHPDNPIPRMLLVIDEFQELFVEDDKLSGQASLILDRIVRQGRSFGVHAVLSSQTLAGSYSLPRTTLGQMAVRIALQCDPSDAQIIFAEDNPAAARLKHPGQAVYNDAGGRIEGNQPMQIGWLPKHKQVEWFAEQHTGYRNNDASTNLLGRTVIYDGNRAATWNANNAALALQQASKEINPDALWCVAGESVAISPAVVYPLTKQAGRNVLMVGGVDAQAATVLHLAATALQESAADSDSNSDAKPKLYAVQGAKPTDSHCLQLTRKWKALDLDYKSVDARDVESLVTEVHEIMKQRLESDDADGPTPTVLLSLIQLSRMRELRKEDDFASFGESSLTPDKMLEEILRDGPTCGIHTVIWAESYSTVNRWLSRSAMREMEIRMLMQMSGNDSTNLIDSVSASKLGEHVMLLFDEATGQEQRFRPFQPETLS